MIDGLQVGILNYTVSDVRLKQGIEDAPVGALEQVLALRPVTCSFANLGPFQDDGKRRYGFIAQEVEKVIPSAVHGAADAVDEAGNVHPRSLDVLQLMSRLTQALQELAAKVETLSSQVGVAPSSS